MANLGVLLGTSPQHLILRAQEWDESKALPTIGESVYTVEKKRIGIIADIFGPVNKPFISVQLARGTDLKLAQFKEQRGMSLYTLPGKAIHKGSKPLRNRPMKITHHKPKPSRTPHQKK